MVQMEKLHPKFCLLSELEIMEQGKRAKAITHQGPIAAWLSTMIMAYIPKFLCIFYIGGHWGIVYEGK